MAKRRARPLWVVITALVAARRNSIQRGGHPVDPENTLFRAASTQHPIYTNRVICDNGSNEAFFLERLHFYLYDGRAHSGRSRTSVFACGSNVTRSRRSDSTARGSQHSPPLLALPSVSSSRSVRSCRCCTMVSV
jgi:hypothetical protein